MGIQEGKSHVKGNNAHMCLARYPRGMGYSPRGETPPIKGLARTLAPLEVRFKGAQPLATF